MEPKDFPQAYIDACNAQDIDRLAGFFAADGSIEDPYGKPWIRGEGIRKFFADNVKNGFEASLEGQPRCRGDSVAMAYSVSANGRTIHPITVFQFNGQGKVVKMTAYWGRDNVEKVAPA